MEAVLTFLTNVPTNAVLIVLALALILRDLPAFAKYIPFWSKVQKISDTQEKKYPMIEHTEKLASQIDQMLKQQNTIMENHFKHEIPQINATLGRIEDKLDTHGNRITRLEALSEK
jgi:peptidoglycan hydrolase CwlO-like protein